MIRCFVASGIAALACCGGALAWDFRTSDGSVYCRFGLQERFAFGCVRRSDGRWIAFSSRPRLSTGVRASFRGVRDRRAFVLRAGRSWSSSDASVYTCWHFRRGVTCKLYSGLSFWLGSSRGYRLFRDKPGFVPHVRPLFRTTFGVRCGIELWTLEPSHAILRCWRPRDGRELTLGITGRGSSRLWPKSEGFRPRGFDLLRPGETSAWRCREFHRVWAEECSLTRGVAVFTCRLRGERLSCVNRARGRFWVTSTRFGAR